MDALPLSVLRNRAGMTQRELAAEAGLHHLTINGIENQRERQPRPATMRAICQVLGCRPEDVEEFSGRVQPKRSAAGAA